MMRLDGHKGMVRGACELDNERILSWSDDKTLRIWDKKGHLINTLSGHTDVIIGALLLKNGNILSWAGKYFKETDVTLRLWDHNGDLLAILDGHTRSVEGAIELNDGNLLSWSPDKTLCMWDTHGQLVTTFHGHTGKINGAMELPDGLLLSWGGLVWEVKSQYKNSDSSLRLWNKDGECIGVFTGHTDSVTGAILLPEGHILSWSEDSTLRIWDIAGLSLDIQYAHSNEVYGVFILDDGRSVSWGYSDMICLWDENGNKLDTLNENYRTGNRALVFAWAKSHNFDIAKIYRKSRETPFTNLDNLQVSHTGSHLYVRDARTNKLLCTFYGETEFTLPEIKKWQGHIVIVVGDKAGRVLFLRWVGEDGV